MIAKLTEPNFLLYYPFALSVVLVSGMVIRTLLVKIQTGQNPNYLKASDDVMGFCTRLYSLVFVIMLAFIGGRLLEPSIDILAGPILLLASKGMLAASGVFIGGIGVFISLWAMVVISKNWRIGVPDSADNDDDIKLVNTGPFAFSRNPFFLGVQLLYIGLFLMIPNAITLMSMALVITTVNIQVREEEKYLSKKIGATYDTYKNSVRRWM